MPEPLRSDDGQTFGFLDPKATEALLDCHRLSSTSRRRKSLLAERPSQTRLPSGFKFRQPMTRSCAGLDGAASPKFAKAAAVESSAGSQVMSRCSSTSSGRSTS